MRDFRILVLASYFLSIFGGHCYADSLEAIESLPYLAWSEHPDSNQSGVIKYDKNKASDGYNFYSDDISHAYLMGMDGRVVYRWTFPGTRRLGLYVRLLDDGSILIACGRGFMKFDKNSKLIWKKAIVVNHDIEILSDGTFLVLGWEPAIKYNHRNVFFDSIFHLSSDGQMLDRWSTYGHLKELQKLHLPSLLDAGDEANEETLQCFYVSNRRVCNYYHLNSIQSLPATSLGLKDKRFQEGNWLVCSRGVNLVFIIDKNTRQVVWSWGPGILDGPHMPRMLNNGNILIYDNGYHRSYSRLIMINPITDSIIWEYRANPPENFYSKKMGSSQQLPNGNFLICESNKGHAFEITPDGKIVWEFYNPVVNKEGERGTIYRMIRIPKKEVSGWMNGHLLRDKAV